jgi:hypothetical protein
LSNGQKITTNAAAESSGNSKAKENQGAKKMISRILIAFAVVIGCYFFPSYVDSEYTNLARLRENTYFSAALIACALIFVRGWTAIFICLVECCLMYCNLHMAFNWDLRDTIFISQHYTTLQQAAFYTELAIIGARIITGLREIGADADSYFNWVRALIGSIGNRKRGA